MKKVSRDKRSEIYEGIGPLWSDPLALVWRTNSSGCNDQHRGNERERGYTKALRNAMERWKRSHPLCLGCSAIGRVTQTAVTDHIMPAKGDHALLWDQANWQPACKWHHDVIKQKLELRYADGNATASDLRLDSRLAIEMTKQERSVVGADGWLMN
jgi:5-methylcytosine-specific restriction protein A